MLGHLVGGSFKGTRQQKQDFFSLQLTDVHLCDAVKFWVFWTLQAVWVWVTLLPVMILNGCAHNPSKPLMACPAL